MKKKRILLGLSAFALVGLATVLSSCDGDKKYTVKFVDGQQEITKTEVTGGYNVAVPEAPTADGKTFNGWYKDAALTDPFDFGSIINGDTTVYAAWLNEYVVTFKSGDATYKAVPVTKGYNVAVPTAPTKESYVFAGWYADQAFTTPFYFGTVIEADTTIYAKWVEEDKSVTVDFIANVDGIELESGATEKGGTLSALPTLADTVTNYVIEGYYIDESFTTPFTLETVVNADMDVYVKLKAVYTVSFETAQGEAPASILRQTKITVADLPSINVDYYIFKGWALEGETTILTEDLYITADTKLVAVLEAIPTIEALKASGAEVIDPNELDASYIEDYTRRGYVDPVMKASDAKDSANKTVILPTNSDNDVIVSGEEGSKVYELTDKGNNATYFYIDSFYSKGTVEAAVDFSITNQGNSWTFLRVNGTNSVKTNAELFGLRIDGGDIKYRLNGGSVVTPLAKIAAENDKTYHIYLKADLDNGKIFVAINGKAFAEFEMEDLSLDTISFVTSNSGSRTIKISEIALVSDMEDADFVANIKARLAKLAEPYKKAKSDTDPVEYYYDQTEVNAIIEEATASIDAATKWSEYWVSLEVANIQFSRLRTFEEKIVDQAKSDAKTAIAEYADSLELSMFKEVGYKDTSASEVVETSYAVEIKAVNDVIDDATTIDQITNTESGIIALFKTRIATFTNDKEDMIAYYKSAKVAALEEKYPSEVYTTEKTAYDAAFSDLNTALTTATTKTDIDAALTTADTTLAAVEKDSYNLLKANELRAYAKKEVEKLLLFTENQYTGSEYETTITNAIDAQVAIINAIEEEKTAEIDEQLSTSKGVIAGVISNVKAATEIEITFVSDVISVSKQIVLVNSTVSKPLLNEEQLSSEKANGLTKTYEILGYYTSFENETYSDEYSFDASVSLTSAHTLYVKTRIAKYTFEPTSAADIENNGVFTFVDADNSGIYDKGVKFDKTGDGLRFTAEGSGSVKITPTLSDYSVKVGVVENNVVSNFSDGVESVKSLELYRTSTTEYSIERAVGKGIKMTKVVVEIGYGTPITLTQKVSTTASEDIKTTVLSGNAISLTDAVKTGFVFDGWFETFENDTYSDLITTESITLDADKTIYAKFSPITYNVTFDSNSGSAVDPQNGIAYNGTITEPTKPTRDGFIFLDWNTKDGVNDDWGEKYDFATQLTEVPTSGNVIEITLYARWLDQNDAEKSTVTFNLNGGEYNSSTDDVVVGGTTGTIYKGYSTVEELTGVTQTNKEFAGWYTKNGKDSGDWGDEFDFASFVEDKELTLYARWYDTIAVNNLTSQTDTLTTANQRPGYVDADTHPNTVTSGVITYKFNADLSKDVIMTNGTTLGLAFNDASKSDGTRYIKVVLDKVGKIKIGLSNATDNLGYVSIGSSAATATSTDQGALEVPRKKDNAGLTEFVSSTLSAGTYYINWSRKQILFNYITVETGENAMKSISSVSATIEADIDSISVSDVRVTPADSTVKPILLTNSSDYSIVVKNSNNEIKGDYSTGLVQGEYTVIVKYGDYTVKTYTVSLPNYSIKQDTNLVLGTSNSDLVSAFGIEEKVEGDSLRVGRFVYDATASSAKIALNGSDNIQFNAGSKIVFSVKKGAVVTVTGYQGNYAYSVDGVEATSEVTSIFVAEDKEIVVLATDNKYLKTIDISYPELIDDDTELSKNITATDVDKKEYKLAADLDFSTVPFALAGTIQAGANDTVQFANTTELSFYVGADATIVVTGHSVGYGVFDIYVNGVKQNLEIDANAKYTFVTTEDSFVEIKAKNVGTETPDYSHSYLAGIKISF